MTRKVSGQRESDNGEKYQRSWIDADTIKIIVALLIGSGGTGAVSMFSQGISKEEVQQIHTNKQTIETHISADAIRYNQLKELLNERNDRILEELKEIKSKLK